MTTMKPRIGLADIVARSYEAACDADAMGTFVQDTAEFFNAQQAALVIWPLRRPEAMLPITSGISTDEIRAHFEFRDKPDTVFGRLAALPAGQTFEMDGLLASPPEQTLLAGTLCADEKNRCGIVFMRDKTNGLFSETDHESLREISAFFDRAIQLNRRFVNIFNTQKTLMAVLNGAPRGIITFGQNAQIVHMNTEGKRIIDEMDGVNLSGNTVHLHDEEARTALHEFLEYARSAGDLKSGHKRLSVSIKRRSLRAPYQMMTFALPFKKRQADLNEDEAMAAMVIYDPATGIDIKTDGLKTFYDLSNAEARLAESLCTGRPLPDAAKTLGISVNTARSQLRGIFKKVGVQSQAALLREFAKALKLPELPR